MSGFVLIVTIATDNYEIKLKSILGGIVQCYNNWGLCCYSCHMITMFAQLLPS